MNSERSSELIIRHYEFLPAFGGQRGRRDTVLVGKALAEGDRQPNWELVTQYPIAEYECGRKVGQRVRLITDLPIRTQDGCRVETIKAGVVWDVLTGTSNPPTVWFRAHEGERHTWTDTREEVFEYFEIVDDAADNE